ncbi:MAG: hypothetical protein DRR16_05215 [Candidatus Parabeggiatoa sp. nov. 3]|jgi:hypothetical protein|nr:MAG: hypothetical protein DRR00_03780 [Gammaproteobacteria bacterium]RKZ68576.1 MAG: hypothetical protein DRQ99_03380 [Gammaproteobacteria bacterium]RKZ88335.1 MAG: hypothetical protein DRR16_05215 [Gammaproteobacteria bacterium]
MNNQIILDAIDDMLNELDLMSDEKLQAEYENLNYGSVGRVFIEAEDFFAFLLNESIEEYTMNNPSIDSYIYNPFETHGGLIGKTLVNDDVHKLLAA